MPNYIKHNVAYNRELAAEAWSGPNLRKEVRYKLLRAAEMFVDYLEIPNFKIIDIVLTGSMANFNYTKFSDFDVHVVTRYSDLECDDLAEAFYQAKKKIWNDDHDVIVRGHEVELYVEDVEQPPVAGGVYSLLDDTWITQPSYEPPEIDNAAVNAKVEDLIKRISSTISGADDEGDVRRLLDKIRRMRRAGLDTDGEYSVENLAFKILRNLGYLDQLSKAIKDQQDQALSLR
jgi:predicted nucleotidyltransferase